MDYQHGVAARTVWGEARGEGPIGISAVAHVLFNRLKSGEWGSSLANVCLWRNQFSCWRQSDPNYQQIISLDDGDPLLQQCLGAIMAVEAGQDDPTLGSRFYKVVGTWAPWAVNRQPRVVVGRHEFYSDVS